MKNYFILAVTFLIAMALSLPGCKVPQPLTYQEKQQNQLLDGITASTVTLLQKTDINEYNPLCTGVWISSSRILTARHCVEDDELSYSQLPGLVVPFRVASEIDSIYSDSNQPHYAVVVGIDPESDLALLNAIDSLDHGIVELRKNPIHPGTSVYVLGHPARFEYSFLPGMISSTRENLSSPFPWKTLQISGPIWFGVSGGGAFDMDGRLVGIASAIHAKVPNMAFFIPVHSITKFLVREDVIL